MSENWKVVPDGGGDFSDTETAKNAKNGACTGRGIINFDLHDGTNDLQEWTVDGFTNQDAANHPEFVVSKAERHDRTKASGGAWVYCDAQVLGIDVANEHTKIEGVRLVADNGFFPVVVVQGVSHVVIDGCLLVGDIGYFAAPYLWAQSLAVVGMSDVIIRNNLIYAEGAFTGPGLMVSVTGTASPADMSIVISNNSINGSPWFGASMTESDGGPGAEATLNVILENTICTNNTPDFLVTIVRGSINANNNCSEDETAGALPGSGNIFYQNPADLFVAVGTDHGLKEGSNALNAGKTIISFDWDAVHVDGDNWRPQGAAWDMGAIEMEAAGIARPKVGATLADGLAGGRLTG